MTRPTLTTPAQVAGTDLITLIEQAAADIEAHADDAAFVAQVEALRGRWPETLTQLRDYVPVTSTRLEALAHKLRLSVHHDAWRAALDDAIGITDLLADVARARRNSETSEILDDLFDRRLALCLAGSALPAVEAGQTPWGRRV